MSSSGGLPGLIVSGLASIASSAVLDAHIAVLYQDAGNATNAQRLIAPRGTLDADVGSNSIMAMAGLFNGVNWDRQRTPKIFIPLNAVSIAAEATLWTPAAGKKFRLMGFSLASGTVGGGITLKDNTAGTTILIVPTATVAVAVNGNLGNGILSAAANNVLTGTGIATETVTGYLFGTEE